MKAAQFDYVRPSDVAEALQALASIAAAAKLLAGGQSLGPMLNLRLARPQLLVDVSRIDGVAADRGQGRRLAHRRRRHPCRARGRGALAGGELLARGRRAASPIARCATAARSAAASRMPIRRPTGRSRLRRSARTRQSAGAAGDARVPAERVHARRLHHGARRRRDHRVDRRAEARAPGALGLLQVLPQDRRVSPRQRRGAASTRSRSVARLFVGALSGAPQPLRHARAQRSPRRAAAATDKRWRRRSRRPRRTSTRSSGACTRAAVQRAIAQAFGHEADRAHRQRPQGRKRWSSRARTSPISCASSCGSPARISAASTACAAPARC